MEDKPKLDIHSQPISPDGSTVTMPPESSNDSSMYGKSKHNKALSMIVAIVVLFLVLLVAYWLGTTRQNTTDSSTQQAQESTEPELETPTMDETADWQTYTNEEYGFSFKYPAGYILEKLHNNKILLHTSQKSKDDYDTILKSPQIAADGYASTDPYIYFDTQSKNPDESLSDLMDTLLHEVILNEGIPVELVEINNVPVMMYESAGYSQGYHLYFDLSDSVLYLDIEYLSRPEELEQIISTFEFIDNFEQSDESLLDSQTSTTSSITYTDHELGYSITYPDTWFFRRTYGSDIPKLAPTDIISGVDMGRVEGDYNNGGIVLNILSANGLSDIEEWIEKHDLNAPEEQAVTRIVETKNGIVYVTYEDYIGASGNQVLRRTRYFIDGEYVYRMYITQYSEISKEVMNVANSLIH